MSRPHPWGPLLAGTLFAVLLLPDTASAHAFLVNSTPASGERLASSPSSIELQFSEPVAGGERVEMTSLEGEPVAVGRIQRLRGGLMLEVPLEPLPDGGYVVSWEVVAQDGAHTLGEFAFAVGQTGTLPAGRAGAGGDIPWPEAAMRWLFLAGLLLAFGGLASEWVVWSPVGDRSNTQIPRSPVGWLLLLALLGGIAQAILVAGRLGPAGGGDAVPAWVAFATTRPGLLAVAQAVLVAYGLWLVLLPLPWARRSALVPLGLALAVSALRGHAGTVGGWWALASNVVHLGAISMWTGALAHLVLVARRLSPEQREPVLGQGARRYAALALGLVAVVVGSGVVVAVSQFTTVSQITGAMYGRVLLVKLALAAAALGLAAVARRRALPTNPHPRPGLLERLTRAEGLFLIGAIAAAAVLATTASPKTMASAGADLLGPRSLKGPVQRRAGLAGLHAVFVEATDGRLQVRVLGPGGDPAEGAAVDVEARSPDGSEFQISPRPCGPGCATSGFPWERGTTTVDVSVASDDWEGGTLQVPVSWPPMPEDPAILEQVIEAMRAQPLFSMTERVSSGPGASARNTISLTGEQFVELELYSASGATDVRPVPAAAGRRALTFYLPGSSIWYLLEIDDHHRILRETIVNPGHLIQRRFAY